MAKIKDIVSNEILNSKGNPTLETTVTLNDGSMASASCPSGTSVGKYEAFELHDGDASRFGGLGVQKAGVIIEKIIKPRLLGMDVGKQQEIDKVMIELDGTQNKSHLGANTTLSVSMAVAKAAAKSAMLPLYLYLRGYLRQENLSLKIPTPLFNLLNGGLHAGGNVNIQEFLLIPASSTGFEKSLEMANAVQRSLKNLLTQNNLSTLVGDEGGFGPSLATNEEAISFLIQAVIAANYRLGYEVFTGIDAAASNFYKDGAYNLKDRAMPQSAEDMLVFYKDLIKKYNLIYLEDPLSEDDWEGWEKIAANLGQDTIVTGDDLTVTNPYRLQMALDKKAVTGVIIKPNQIGTVIEALAVVEVARATGLKIIVSHRSGETNDDFIADFAVAVSADYVKFGALTRGERVAKYNRLLQIEKLLKII